MDHFTVVMYGLNTISPLFSKIRVAYNNLYRTILHVPPLSSASEMFLDNNIPNFETLLRKEVVFYFYFFIKCFHNSIIRAIKTVGS